MPFKFKIQIGACVIGPIIHNNYHVIIIFLVSAISCLFLAVSGTVCATLPASANMFPAFATLRFLAGMGHVGTFMMAFQLAVEYTGREKQALTGCLIEIPFASGK